MGSPVDSGKVLAEAALISTSYAACVIPVAWACAGEIYLMQSDPGALYDAGTAWLHYAGKIGDALSANEELTNSVGAGGWQGSDYEAFTERAADFSRQLMGAWALAEAIGIALITMAVAIFVAIVIAMVMGAALAVHATAILVAVASVVGNLGPSEALMIEAELFAMECEASLLEIGANLTSLAHLLAGTVTALLAGDVAWQLGQGDGDALRDLGQATVDGLGTVATGLLALGYQTTVGKYMKTPYTSTLAQTLGLTDTVRGSSIVDDTTSGLDRSRP